jgi:protein disulfide-isomerase
MIWCITLANVGACKDPQIAWSDDLSATMQLAQSTGKPVLVHFYGDNCPPCRMLEKKAFKDPLLIQAIGEHLLAVRINAERDTKTAARFRVNRWPTDVYLYADGEEIYRNISAQDPAAYEKTVLKVAEKNQRMIGQQRTKRTDLSRKELMALQPKTESASTTTPVHLASGAPMTKREPAQPVLPDIPDLTVPDPTVPDPSSKSSGPVVVSLSGSARVRLTEATVNSVDTADVAITNQSPIPASELAPTPDSQPLVVEVAQPSIEIPVDEPSASSPEKSPALLGEQVQADTGKADTGKTDSLLPTSIAMGGFCPVSLSMAIEASKSGEPAGPAWVKGKPEHAVRHRGRVYHLVSEEALAKFLSEPDRYAPVLSGCDLVEYSKSGKWIDGDCRFGFIEQETGRIFLFSSSLNCQEFAQNCESYSSMVGKSVQP